MLWNVAALVPARSEVLLDAALAQIDAIWTEGLTLRVTGPAPMMSFCTIALDPVTPAQVAWALDRFGLAALDEIEGLAATRRRLLHALAADGEDRAALDHQARLIAAAARLEDPQRPFALCRLVTEDRAAPPLTAEVA